LATLTNSDIVSASGDDTVRVWNSTDGTLKFTLNGHNNSVNALTILSNGDIVSGSFDKTIRVWNSIDGTSKLNITSGSSIYGLTHLQPNDEIVSGGKNDLLIRVWNSTSGTLKLTLTGHSNDVYSLKTLSNGDLVSASNDNTILVWDLTDGTPKSNITYNAGAISVTILSNDEIVCGYSDGSIIIYLSDGTIKQVLDAIEYVDILISFPNDVIVSGADDFAIRIWTNF
jgi:WD40 repeat protein